ncbi:hypothetical protein IJM86_09255 [bacterium]|nr:hypothetical protein [bacterium]MCR5411703.1 hypothetical protein [Patescibacteria group bacterium]
MCSYHNIQYATFVVDRSKRDNTQSYRDNYIKYASLGVSENMDNQHEYIFISDSITQPKKEKQI